MFKFVFSFLLIFSAFLVQADSVRSSIQKGDMKTLKSVLTKSSIKSKDVQENPLFIAITNEKPK